MTDKQKLVALLTEFGVGFTDELTDDERYPYRHTEIRIAEGSASAKVVGYNGFITKFYFSREGKFVEVGLWE